MIYFLQRGRPTLSRSSAQPFPIILTHNTGEITDGTEMAGMALDAQREHAPEWWSIHPRATPPGLRKVGEPGKLSFLPEGEHRAS
jgi:hypothetical protein